MDEKHLSWEQINYVLDKKNEWITNVMEVSRQLKAEFGIKKSVKLVSQSVRYFLKKLWKDEDGGENVIEKYARMAGVNPWQIWSIRHSWDNPDWTRYALNIRNKKEDDSDEIQKFTDLCVKKISKHSPKYLKVKRNKIKDWHLLVIDPADIHLGKLSLVFETWDDYNNKIAIDRVHAWVQGILDKSYWFNIDRILLVVGNDILHVDGHKKTTTAWTNQDTDWLWHKNAMLAVDMYVQIIEKLRLVAPVDIVSCPSNHDWTHWFFVAQILKWWFRKDKDVTFDVDMRHNKYYQYGNNFIMLTHWDWAHINKIPMVAASENAVMRAACDRRYAYLHHLHHKKHWPSGDHIGITIEYLRSPSGTDWRHHRNGYVGVPKAIEWFIHHPEYGQTCRITHNF